MARRLRGSGAFKYCRQALQYSRNLLWKVDFLERGVAQGFQFELKKGDSKNVAPPKVILSGPTPLHFKNTNRKCICFYSDSNRHFFDFEPE